MGITRTCKCGDPVDGRSTRCAPCNRAAVREWRHKNKARAAEHDRKSRYGMAAGDFDALLEKQGGVCALCGTSDWGGRSGSPHVDHDHKTGQVRGLLCNHCNLALGHAKDDPSLLRKMADYLEAQVSDCTQDSHGECDPDICFAAKMAYMRAHGSLSVHYPYGGREAFHGPTIRERQESAVKEAQSNGYTPEPVGTRWI